MEYFEFLNESVTPYHTVENIKTVLDWPKNKEICVFERGGALVAVIPPKKAGANSRFRIALAHTDFPALKVTPNPDKTAAGIQTLHPEIYGGPLYASWLDRDLGYGGLLAYEHEGTLQTKIIRGSKRFRIPQLAIHLNRGVNQEGLKVNPQNDLDILWSAETGAKFAEKLQQELPSGAKLLDFDVQLFDAQPANRGGFDDEWIYSGRLDNLSSCHAIAASLAQAKSLENDFIVGCFFNNEEVGSTTREGASGNLLRSTLESLWRKFVIAKDPCAGLDEALAESLALSIDMAHGLHPNFVQKHEQNHAPLLGGGVVLKLNAQKRYASDVFSCAKFKWICEQGNIPYQTFVMRNDMPCGSTVGPAISSNLGIPTVDIGEPMFSMHSIREMTAVKDHESMEKLVSSFFFVNFI